MSRSRERRVNRWERTETCLVSSGRSANQLKRGSGVRHGKAAVVRQAAGARVGSLCLQVRVDSGRGRFAHGLLSNAISNTAVSTGTEEVHSKR